MSFRTILVGILAAICGVSATVGVNLLNKQKPVQLTGIVVARMKIDQGTKITKDMVQVKEWPANLLPPEAVTNSDQAVGMYATSAIIKDEPLLKPKLKETFGRIVIPEGFLGVAIETPNEASAVGGLLVPGNRVDVILTITQRHEVLGGPMTLTLLENIEVLAVGQQYESSSSGMIEPDKRLRSVTLLVREGNMANEINLGQEIGKLHLALRSPTDVDSREPKTATSLRELIAQKEIEPETRENPQIAKLNTQIEDVRNQVLGFIDQMTNRFAALEAKKVDDEAQKDEAQKIAYVKIPAGMRAITIQTPNEAAGVAGLLQPTNRVDVLLTLDARSTRLIENTHLSTLPVSTLELLANVEVLAVDTKLEETTEGADTTMSRSVTLLVEPKMAEDLNLANKLGTIGLTLRGPADSDAEQGPVRSTFLDQLLLPLPEEEGVADAEPIEQRGAHIKWVRMNRGGFSQDVKVYTGRPAPQPEEAGDTDTH